MPTNAITRMAPTSSSWFSDSPSPGAVFVEALTNGHYLEREAGLDGYGLVFEYLRSSALNPSDSLDMIAAIAADA
ncbi:Scr1 family TA system antitoxin-like transcriptional regulator [Streptomyces sp. SP17BM10]|uniref:Scr1 family TA system antitoxin-like transcriptional regulator n=1 Tax=Streptomyces sp. SP17BM10 TaxID=3002530 RepID=UPI002E79816C|nr:Scr1 family TA system antitoxin-like transcriptional regulator [Streptomyces sp. SP17BM10]MEE1786446.1 Scr1 family TA system antitoxin-like transcriptional regulator [Streptomyces sp. SP17BM10]